MINKNWLNGKLAAGTGMAMGVLISAAMALVVQVITGDGSVWSWAIPVGLATGLAIGTAGTKKNNSETK